jgi:hypothetical protein
VVVRRIASCLCLAAILAARSIGAETFLIQSGEDSSPYSFTPNTARGFRSTAYAFTNDEAGVDHSFEYFIRFNLPAELFEPGVVIESALAWVYYGYDYTVFGDTTTEVGEVACRTVLGPWSQATLTWNNRPPVGEVFDGWVNVTKKGMYWCDVKDLVEGWIAGGPNHGIAITSDMPRVMGYHTYDDGSVSPNFRPSLLVETVPEPRGSLWAGAALLFALRRRAPRVPGTSTSNHETR